MKRILFLGLCLLALAACNQQPAQTPIHVDFQQGTSGVEVEFVQNLPPPEIFEGSPFIIGAKLHNRGAYQARLGEIRVSGFDGKYFAVDNGLREVPSLTGRALISPQGEIHVEEFQARNNAIPLTKNQFTHNYAVEFAYDYETVLDFDLCVNTYLFTDLATDFESCKTQKSFTFGGQGAPVAITKVEQILSPGTSQATMNFKIYVEDKGNGDVVGPVRLREVKLANRRLTCSNKEVDLSRENKFFVCTTTERPDVSYLTTLSASVVYRYKVSKPGKVVVQKLQTS